MTQRTPHVAPVDPGDPGERIDRRPALPGLVRVGIEDAEHPQTARAERGESSVSLDLLQRLAKHLQVSITDLVGDQIEAGQGDAAQAIATDQGAPPGLRDLAADDALVQALRITPAEWRTMGSVELPRRVTKDGYVQLLMTLRVIVG